MIKMKNLLATIILSPVLVFGQQKCCFQNTIFLGSPSPLIANVYSSSNIILTWSNIGAGALYTLQRATDLGFTTNLTTLYSGLNLTYSDTGLSTNTIYYYRINAALSGYHVSNYTSVSATTMSFTALAMYNFDGIYPVTSSTTNYQVNEDNDTPSGTWSNLGGSDLGITVIKPLLGVGPTFNYNVTTKPIINTVPDYSSISGVISSRQQSTFPYLDGASAITMPSDFTIAFEVRLYSNGGTGTGVVGAAVDFLSNTANTNSRVFLVNNNGVRLKINGTDYTPLYPNFPLYLERWHKVFIQRSGTNIRVGEYLNGGMSWGSYVSASSSSFIIDRLFQSNTPAANVAFDYVKGQMWFVGSLLSDSQCGEIATWGANPAYAEATPLTGTIPVTGVTNFTAIPTDGYVVDPTNGGYYQTRKLMAKIITFGDKTFVAQSKKPSDFNVDGFKIIDHTNWKYSDTYYFPVIGNSTDVHLSSTYFKYDNRIYRSFVYAWYDLAVSNSLNFQHSGENFKMDSWSKHSYVKATRNTLASFPGEPNELAMGNTIFQIYQEFNPISGGAQFMRINKSIDNLNSWETNRLIDTGAGNQWVYYITAYSIDGGSMYLIINLFSTALTQYYNTCVLKSVTGANQGYVWTNVSGSFSKDIRNMNAITLSDLTTNFSVISTSTTNAHVMSRVAFIKADGELYMTCGDGSANDQTTGAGGHKLMYTSSGSLIIKSIPSVVGGHTLVSPQFMDGGFLMVDPADVTGNTLRYFVAETAASNNWPLIEIKTVDKGTNWTFVATHSSDPSMRHDLIRGSDNYPYTGGHIILTCLKSNGVYPVNAPSVQYFKSLQ